jgi:HD superfamily phosphohydrolase
MKKLNETFHGKLNLAIEIFEGKHKRKFFYQLISSQLDIDRLDYLKRDSFYTGVTEGNISSDRLIAMMNVTNDELVIEKKGIYSVEKFLIARRLMYWQVYLHKTGLVAENMLVRILQRAKELALQNVKLPATKTMQYFLYNQITNDNFTKETLEEFSKLDDYDVLSAIKEWTHHSDVVLSKLSKMIINRNLLKIEMRNEPFSAKEKENYTDKLINESSIGAGLLHYFMFSGKVLNQAYNSENPIKILYNEGKTEDIAKASDQLNLQALTKPVEKYYMCYPKKMLLANS